MIDNQGGKEDIISIIMIDEHELIDYMKSVGIDVDTH